MDDTKFCKNFYIQKDAWLSFKISDEYKFDLESMIDIFNGLKNGTISLDDVEPIRVFKQNGKIYSLDNRRLYAFKQAGMDGIKVEWVNPTDPKIAKEIGIKFTTMTDGLSISVRGTR